MAKINQLAATLNIMAIIEITKIEINRRPYWIYAIIEMAKIEINRRPYWIYANYRDGQNRN